MWKNVKRYWRQFRQGRSGHRFEERYQRNQQKRKSRPLFWRFLEPCAGIIFVLAGIVFCFIPGPGLPLLIAGAGLLAGHSRTIAHIMDALELNVRKLIRWGMDLWSHASGLAKAAVILLTGSAMAGAAYGTYQIFLAP